MTLIPTYAPGSGLTPAPTSPPACDTFGNRCTNDNQCKNGTPQCETSVCKANICAFSSAGSIAPPALTPKAPPPPCAASKLVDIKDKNGKVVGQTCAEVDTAIGPIQTDPKEFVKRIFGLVLSLSGGIAVLLIIVSGYKLMVSQGNQEKTQAAREMLTSAIVGLLFIIFSLVILQIIGVDILKLPGFGN